MTRLITNPIGFDATLNFQLTKIHPRANFVENYWCAKDKAKVVKTYYNFISSRGGYIKYTIPLNITKYLSKEDEYVPWAAVDNNMGFITSIVPRSSPAYKFLEVCTIYKRPVSQHEIKQSINQSINYQLI